MPESHTTVRARFLAWGDVAWRLLAIGAVVYFGFQAFESVTVVFVAGAVALFLAAVLWVPTRWLMDRRWPPLLAALVVLVGALAVLGGVFALVLPPLFDSFADISEDLTRAWEAIREWLVTGPLGLSETRIQELIDMGIEQLQAIGGDTLLTGATAAAEFLTGTFLMVVFALFMLKDGRRMASALLDRLPTERAEPLATALGVGWRSLARYMGSLAVVGIFDALMIGLGLLIVGVPLVLPLAVLVFFGAFLPIIGAFVSGLVAVAVAFVNGGVVDALIILAIITVVQQVEGDVILPLVFGQTLRMHPLVILIGVTAGGLAFGLIGAFIVVPIIAVALAIHEALIDDPERSIWQLARG